MKINLQLFGALKQSGIKSLDLDLPENSTIADLRAVLESHLMKSGSNVPSKLIQVSAFATEQAVLKDSDIVTSEYRNLAILPPVSGG